MALALTDVLEQSRRSKEFGERRRDMFWIGACARMLGERLIADPSRLHRARLKRRLPVHQTDVAAKRAAATPQSKTLDRS